MNKEIIENFAEASHSYDVTKNALSKIGNNEILVNQNFGFQIYLTLEDLDKLDVEINCYQPDASILKLQQGTAKTAASQNKASSADSIDQTCHPNSDRVCISESVFSRLLKSNCPVTDQPDWACIQIQYTGPAIDHASLLKYIVSYRMHNGFHEHCVEKIFVDILKQCAPTSLSVYARYTRRGGLDINPWRATFDVKPPALGRSARQ